MSALGDFFKEVADAIRSKKGTTDIIVPIDFPQEILSIETGATPTGDIEIKENGTYDVTNYANAVVNVPTSGGSGELKKSGKITCTYPTNTYQILYQSLGSDGAISYSGMPMYAITGNTSCGCNSVVVGTDIYFVCTSQSQLKYRNVVVSNGLEVIRNGQDFVVVRVNTEGPGTITITNQ